MTLKMPLVSVIVPTYNYACFICEAIDSVLNQNFPQDQIEVIVVDDGSTDNTADKMKKYGSAVNYIVKPNSGKASSTKVGLDLAKGKYIFNLDADDIFLPGKIRQVVDIFEGDNEIVHVAHPAIYWTTDKNASVAEPVPEAFVDCKNSGEQVLSYFYQKGILFGGGSTFAARASALRNFQIPQEVDMFIDEYLVIFTLDQGYSFFISQPLSKWRIHGTNFSNKASTTTDQSSHSLRFLKSQKAVLSEVLRSNFSDKFKGMYSLKTKVHELSIKEKMKQKTTADILEMWILLFKNIHLFKSDIVEIINSYCVLNRTLPTPVFQVLKKMKELSLKCCN